MPGQAVFLQRLVEVVRRQSSRLRTQYADEEVLEDQLKEVGGALVFSQCIHLAGKEERGREQEGGEERAVMLNLSPFCACHLAVWACYDGRHTLHAPLVRVQSHIGHGVLRSSLCDTLLPLLPCRSANRMTYACLFMQVDRSLEAVEEQLQGQPAAEAPQAAYAEAMVTILEQVWSCALFPALR